jgi:DNA-binding LacI/PurR family transcriptional regulator
MTLSDTIRHFLAVRPAVSQNWLARESGVNKVTILRILRGHAPQPATEAKIREAMRKYGYEA